MNIRTRASALMPLVTFWLVAQAACSAPSSVAARAKTAPVVTISPLAGTPTAMPATQISFLGAPARSLGSISVIGSQSGRHRGRLRSYSSAPGASFVPDRAFVPGERVSVQAKQLVHGRARRTLRDSFTIAQPASVAIGQIPSAPEKGADVQSFQSRPDLHPPVVTVLAPATATYTPGYFLVTPSFGPGQHGPMIFDKNGEVVWFRPLAGEQNAAGLQIQVLQDRRVLTWWQGRSVPLGHGLYYGLGEDVVANHKYETLAVVKAGNGLQADSHSFVLDDDPSGVALIGPAVRKAQPAAYLLAYSPVRTSLASVGGPDSGVVLDGVVQQVDVHTGLVMWEWHTLGHVALSESDVLRPSDPSEPFDYAHLFSVVNGGKVVSIAARATKAVYDVESHTGAVVRRQLIPGAFNPVGEGGDSESMGEDNSFSGGGTQPTMIETDRQERVLFEARLPAGDISLRAFHDRWSGHPSEPPAISANTSRSPIGSATTVYASWNGATTVASWQLLAGAGPSEMEAVSRTRPTGFETTIPSPAARYVAVRALDASGRVLARSKTLQSTGA